VSSVVVIELRFGSLFALAVRLANVALSRRFH
jgi:hypothetical protein